MSEQDAATQEYYDDEEDSISELSSSPSIPEGEIDFNFVYALHTFMATVEGQATSTKGDTLVLLDDTNSYWWLVRNIKDDSIGYLPAEHIETPPERLARLNKHRNVDNGAAQMIDINPTTTKGTSGSRKFSLRKSRKPASKSVTFSSPRFIEYEVLDSESEAEDDGTVTSSQQQDMETTETQEGKVEELKNQGHAIEEPIALQQAGSPSPNAQMQHGYGTQNTREATAATHPDTTSIGSRHGHKTSQGSFVSSEAGSSITTLTEEGDAKDGVSSKQKKKNVFSGLFKKKSKREKQADTTTSNTVDSSQKTNDAPAPMTGERPMQVVEEAQSAQVGINPLQRRVNTSELPDAVKEMRSSVLMETDPVSVDMVEEPHARGLVDEVEMLHTQQQQQQQQESNNAPDTDNYEPLASQGESFVWTDRAVEAYLESEGDLYKRLLAIVHVQAKSARAKQGIQGQVQNHAFDEIEQSINKMLKEIDALLVY